MLLSASMIPTGVFADSAKDVCERKGGTYKASLDRIDNTYTYTCTIGEDELSDSSEGGLITRINTPHPDPNTNNNNDSSSTGNDCNGVKTFFNWGCNGNGIMGLLMTVLNWLSIGVVLAVIGGVIYGGIIYSTSNGDSGKTQEAVSRIRSAVVALVMYFAMWAVLNWLMPGGMFH